MKALKITLLLILAAGRVFAQSSSVSDLDGLTPEGLQPGAPSGSYALSGFDTVNLYNGSVNLAIPSSANWR